MCWEVGRNGAVAALHCSLDLSTGWEAVLRVLTEEALTGSHTCWGRFLQCGSPSHPAKNERLVTSQKKKSSSSTDI